MSVKREEKYVIRNTINSNFVLKLQPDKPLKCNNIDVEVLNIARHDALLVTCKCQKRQNKTTIVIAFPEETITVPKRETFSQLLKSI